jgi:thymidine kinase
MFSGKSEELIRRIRRAQIARQRVQVFKPLIDDRYSEDEIVSHSEMRIDAIRVAPASEILARVDPRTQVVGIDEAQFFDEQLVEVVDRLANMGKRVIVAGLDQDFMGRAFDPIPQLLAKGTRLGVGSASSHDWLKPSCRLHARQVRKIGGWIDDS